MAFKVFTRNWYRREGRELVPNPGARKTHLRTYASEEAARQFCREYNASNAPGPLSRKAEYTEA